MVTTRPLSDTERAALSAAYLNTLELTPYFATALFRMSPVAAEGLGTFAVDRGWRLYIDPQALIEWGPKDAGAVLAHEVSHLLRSHADRAAALGAERDHYRWNLATDAAINADLISASITLPEGAVTPASLGLPPNGIEEEYYHQLTPTDQPDTGDGCGSGAGDPAAEWELDSRDSSAPALPGTTQRITRRMVAEAINEAEAKDPGTVPGNLRRWATQALAPPQVNWRTQLQAAVRRAVNWSKEGQSDYTYTRPGRRRIPGVITPAMHTPRPTIAAVIDTSGSMSESDLSAALSEIAGITKATGCRGITVVSVDTEATVMPNITSAAQVDLTGGGGTDMRVGINAALTARPAPDVIAVLTDGLTPWPPAPTRQRLIAVLIGTDCPDPPPWITAVRVTAVQ